ncbi:MAG: hypothetical protein II839_13790 [Kiritimatiellae bacterium]|nr:hypothetical protein [Kiritimatiellia bacterium]
MSFPFQTAAFCVLCAALSVEAVRYAVRRARPDGSWASRLLFAAWFMRPLAAAAAVNLWMRLVRAAFAERRAYPFYANLWWPRDLSFPDLCRAIRSAEGLWPWLAVAAAAAGAAAGAAWFLRRRNAAPGRRRLVFALVGLYALACVFFVSLASVPNGFFTDRGRRSSLLAAWHDSGSTMLYALPFMRKGGGLYLRQFTEIQPKLDCTIHALSHPPVGSLFIRWIGAAAGVDVNERESYRRADVRLRFALGQTAVSAANAFLVFLFAAALFDRRTGLFAALLWTVAPSVSGYATFAPDMNYALFFHGGLLFSWLVGTVPSRRRALLCAVPLGLCFAMLVFMNYSWCIATTFFAAFVFAANRRERRGWKDLAVRAVPPLAVMALAAGWVLRHYGLDYLAVYRVSSEYVSGFYHHATKGQMLLALVGGQVEWLVLLGPLACTGFFLFMRESRRSGEFPLQRLFACVLLAVFALPIVFGPPGLKHEVARCWIWIASVPIALSARRWLSREPAPRCAAVVLSSAGFSLLLRLFVDLGS